MSIRKPDVPVSPEMQRMAELRKMYFEAQAAGLPPPQLSPSDSAMLQGAQSPTFAQPTYGDVWSQFVQGWGDTSQPLSQNISDMYNQGGGQGGVPGVVRGVGEAAGAVAGGLWRGPNAPLPQDQPGQGSAFAPQPSTAEQPGSKSVFSGRPVGGYGANPWAGPASSQVSPWHMRDLQSPMGRIGSAKQRLDEGGLSTPARRARNSERQWRADQGDVRMQQRDIARIQAGDGASSAGRDAFAKGQTREYFEQRKEGLDQYAGGRQLTGRIGASQQFRDAMSGLSPEQVQAAKGIMMEEIVSGLRSGRTPDEIYEEQLENLTPGFWANLFNRPGGADLRERVGA